MKTLHSASLLVALTAGFLLAPVQNAAADQPHMRAAIEHLRAARSELEHAEHNKGGHRGRAIEMINRAIAQCEEGIHAGH